MKERGAGDVNLPMSYNGWLYGLGNPVMFTDPSGMIPPPESICDRLPPDDAEICREARECQEPQGCPETLDSIPRSAQTRSDLFIDLLKRCPGWWHKRYNMKSNTDAMKLALAFAFKWETSDIPLGSRVYEAMAEAMAHKIWQQQLDPDGTIPKVSGFEWFLGSRSSMIKRVELHYGYRFFHYPLGEFPAVPFNEQSDIGFDTRFWFAKVAVDDVFGKYYGQTAKEYPHRPFDWANPVEGGWRSAFIGKSEGACPHQIYAVYGNGGGQVTAGNECVVTWDQWQCIRDINCEYNPESPNYDPEACTRYKNRYPNYP